MIVHLSSLTNLVRPKHAKTRNCPLDLQQCKRPFPMIPGVRPRARDTKLQILTLGRRSHFPMHSFGKRGNQELGSTFHEGSVGMQLTGWRVKLFI